jgi:hypothetical protein
MQFLSVRPASHLKNKTPEPEVSVPGLSPDKCSGYKLASTKPMARKVGGRCEAVRRVRRNLRIQNYQAATVATRIFFGQGYDLPDEAV